MKNERTNMRKNTIHENQTIKTKLSFHPSWNIKPEERYVFMFKNNQCPPLAPNQISIYGLDLAPQEDGIVVTAFIRSSLSQSIQIGQTTLLLLSSQGEILGRKTMDLSVIGELPPNSSRPWRFHFSPTELFVQKLPKEDWKIAFELKPKHQLDLDDSWEQNLSSEAKAHLQEMVNQLEVPKPGEINLMGIQAKTQDNGDLYVTLLIRNGSGKHVTLKQLPLQFIDADGDVVAKGVFKLDHLTVKANTSKPWTFIFPNTVVQKKNPNLKKWQVETPK